VPTVTALRAKGRSRVAVELDGKPWRTLPAGAILGAHLSVGTELDRQHARALRRELRRGEALGVVARALRARDLSHEDLRRRLDHASVPPRVRDETLAALQRTGLVDDTRYAEHRANALAGRGYGNAAIAADLERRGIPQAARADALAQLDPESLRVQAILHRRPPGAPRARFLAAKGFGAEAIEAALGPDFANDP
jgi:SOS response regulatory protein OraA/RecX